MIRTIAWATDRSPSAVNALTWAKGLAQQVGARLAIVYVEEVAVNRVGTVIDPDDDAVDVLENIARQLRAEGIQTTVTTARASAGSAAQVIMDLATEAGAGVIVAGNRGHGPLAGLLLGSAAARLIQIAACPVVLVPARRGHDPAKAWDTPASSQPA